MRIQPTKRHDCANPKRKVHAIAMRDTLHPLALINVYRHGVEQAKVHLRPSRGVLKPEGVQFAAERCNPRPIDLHQFGGYFS